MSLFGKLVAKAKGWLGEAAPPPAATQAVHQDRFGQALFDEVLQDAPAMSQLITDLNRDHDYTDDLVRDTFAQFFQAAPRMRTAGEMAKSHLVNHGVATDVAACPETAELRALTQHDKYGAAMATISVGEKVLGYLEQHGEAVKEAAEKAERLQQKAEQAKQDLQQKLEAAEQAGEDLAAAMGDFDGNGPLTEEQAAAEAAAEAAAQAVDSALGKAKRQAGLADAAYTQVDEAAAEAKQGMRGPVREAVQQTADDLAEEAEMFRGWGVDAGQLERMSFEERRRMALRLKNHRCARWAKQLGRHRLLGAGQRAKKVTQARDEVYDTTVSGHLPDVLATEFVSLTIPTLRTDFLVRMTEGRLLSKKYRGVEVIGQGAIIALADTSGSMKNTDRHGVPREVYVKGTMLALLDQARSERRDFVAIIFANADKQRVFHFPKGEASLDQVLEMTELVFGGGTNFEKPLDLAIDIMTKDFDSEGKAKADLVLLTDDECKVSAAWQKAYQAKKDRLGFRTFGVAVGLERPGSTLAALSDNVRAVTEFIDPSTSSADLFRTI